METMSLALVFLFNQAPRAFIQVASGLVIALVTAPYLTCVLLVMPLFAWPLRKLGKKVKRFSRQALESKGNLSDVSHQQFGGIREIKSFRQEDPRQNLFRKANESVFNSLMGIVKARAFTRGLVEGGGYIVVLLAITCAVYIMILFEVSFGEFTSFMFLSASLIMNPLRTLSKAYNDFQNALPGAISILDILDHPEATPENTSPHPFPEKLEGIRFSNVSYRYPGGRKALENISFEASLGQCVAIVGPTGSGKTTLMELLSRFRDPQQGSVCINDCSLKDFSLSDLRKHVAIAGQDAYLFNDSIRENLKIGDPDANDDAFWNILKDVQLEQFVRDKKEGLDFRVGERGDFLSGGQKQRLSIARALLKKAPILILDEATSAQDGLSEKALIETIRRYQKNKIIFVIAHRLSTIQHADLVLMLKDGRLIEQGSHEQLMSNKGLYFQLQNSQKIS
jgi:subfamily B ATP-binding cassette protein MsbA